MDYDYSVGVEFFKKLSLKELRRRQRICKSQTVLAWRDRNISALERLRIMERALTDTIYNKFGK